MADVQHLMRAPVSGEHAGHGALNNQDLENALPKAKTELGAFTRMGLGTGTVKMAFFTIGVFSTTTPLAS